jgi:hypothetical protein
LSAKADVSLRRILGSVSPRTLCDGKKSCQARNSYIEAIKKLLEVTFVLPRSEPLHRRIKCACQASWGCCEGRQHGRSRARSPYPSKLPMLQLFQGGMQCCFHKPIVVWVYFVFGCSSPYSSHSENRWPKCSKSSSTCSELWPTWIAWR